MQSVPLSRDILTNAINILRKKVSQPELDRCRNEPHRVPDAIRKLDVGPCAIEWLKATADATRRTQWNVEAMASTSCCWMRYLLSNLCLAVRLSVKPSLDNLTDDQLHADQTDREIVIAASYTGEFLTFDEGAAWLDTALRKCIQERFWIPDA